MAEKDPETDDTAESNKENYDVKRRWPGPRTVYVPRADNGFGFTLRHFIVYPPESAMQAQPQEDDDEDVAVEGQKRKRSKMSSLDPMDTIFVKQVKDGGPAHNAGLHTGDRIVSVNGESVTGKTYSQVIALIQSTDASLKLLVVPKDEDILQMAYQNSVYRSGSEPHRGEASEIPEPPPSSNRSEPPTHRPVHAYAARGRHMSDSAISVHRNKQYPSGQKYKAEMRVVPEDGPPPQRKISDPGPYRGFVGRTSSLGSTSSSGSSGHSHLPTTVEVSESARHGYSAEVPVNEDVHRESHPMQDSLGKRTSSRNIMLSSNLQTRDSQASRKGADTKPTESSMRSHDNYKQTKDLKDNVLEEVVVPEYASEAHSAASLYSSPSHQSQRYHSGSPTRHQLHNQQSQSKPFLMGTVYAKPTSSAAASSSSISQSQDPYVSNSMRVPPTGTSSAAFITATSSASEGYHQPHRISGAYPGAAYTKDRRRGSSPTSAPSSQSQTYRRGTHDDEYGSSNITQAALSEDGRESPATSVHSWPDTHQHRQNYNHDHRYAQDPRTQASDNRYGPTFTVRFRDRKGATIELPNEQGPFEHTYRSPHSTVTVSRGPPANVVGYPPHINLVTERLKRFQSEDSVDSAASGEGSVDSTGNSSTGRTSGTGSISVELSRSKPLPRVGYESVSSRKAAFEVHSDENLSFDEVSQSKPPRSKRREGYDPSVSRYSPLQAKPPPEIMKVPTTPPATISIYFRKDLDTAMVTPSPERLLIQGQRQMREPSVSSDGSMEPGRDRSPSCHGENNTSPTSPRRHKPALRQPSYLTAINSPHSQGHGGRDRAPLATISPLIEERELEDEGVPFADHDSDSTERTDGDLVNVDPSTDEVGDMLPVSGCATTTSVTTGGVTTTVYMRQPISDRESKLVRRVSYLMATQQEPPKAKITSAMSKSDSQLQPTPASSQIDRKRHWFSSLWLLPRCITKSTPTRTASNIRKLKAFFGEKTPRIVEATTERGKVFDLPAAGELVKEGYLLSKTAVADGKRASDRSWKPYWILLKGHCLYMFKDKAAANTSPTIVEEQPISIKSCIVDIAYDYTKKKNVFRLTTYNGSEFLFQADDRETMLDWIKAIQCNSNPDGDEEAIGSSELIIRKSSQVTESSASITRGSPQQSQKMTKRSSSKTRSKSPASHSPGLRQKKQSIDNIDSPKGKEETKGVSKTWKGKMVKKFKRYGSSSTAPVEVTGTFCVPLEMCPPSTFNENVPLVVEVCTRIVEDRGIENQGIYRVPGNTGAVNSLQEELNKVQDVDDLNLEEDKWLDINVVSSLLKSFFRKLPEPLVTDELYDYFINANRHENPEKRMLRLKKLIHELPDHNFDTLQYLATHLNKVSSYGHSNKMDARNLAIVFGPTLIRTKDESMVTMVKDMSDQCRIVESILTHCEWFFSSWDADIDVPADEQEEGAMPVSGMNQELLSKAEHLELGERGKEFSAKDLVSSVISAANRKMKKREKSSKSVLSVDTGSMDSTDIPTGDYQPPCEYNERNIDREIELRSIVEDSSMESNIVSSTITGSGMTPLTGHGMASSTSTLTSTLSQEMLLQQMVSSTHQRSARSASSAGIQQHRARSQERLLSQKMQVHSHSAGNLPSIAAAGGDALPAPLGGSTRDGIYNAKLVYITGTESQPNMTSTPQQQQQQQQQQDDRQANRASVHYEVKKYPAYQLEHYQLFQTENSKPQMSFRRGSADSVLSERRGDDEIGHHPSSVTKSRTYQAQQHIKRLQLDAAALRQKDEERRVESEKRAVAKQRIEMELEKTRAELERDDSLEELLAKPTQIAAQIAEYHSKYGNDYGTKADTTSITSTSDYSTMSSTATGHHMVVQPPPPSNVSDYSSNASPPRGPLDLSAYSTDTTATSGDNHVSMSDFPQGGKYFMVTGPAQSVAKGNGSKHFDTSKVAGKGTLSRRKGSQASPQSERRFNDDSPPQVGHRSRPRCRTGSTGPRRGSLDSNVHERPLSTRESDSEISEDFVDSMTSAFDEKLKLLSDSPDCNSKSLKQPDTYTVQYCEGGTNPPKLALPHSMQHYEIHRNNSESMLFDKYFTDARFKTHKGDPKIGIASRFERKDIDSPEQKQSRWSTGIGLHRDLSDPTGRSSAGYMSGSGDQKGSGITKSEKTDFNLLTKKMDARALEYAQALRRSSEKLYSSKEYLVDIGLDESDSSLRQTVRVDEVQRMPSPQVVRRKDGAARRKLRRRHTVGGTNDLEHFKALMSATGEVGSSPEESASAWERLQPGPANDAQSNSSSEAPSNMSWLQQQRLRHVGSSPAVFQPESHALRDHDYYSTDLDDYSSDYRLQPVSAYHGTPRNPFHNQRHSQPPLTGYGSPIQYMEPGRLALTPTDQHSQRSSVSSSGPASPSFTFESSI